jgi:hypothetical protein
MPTKIPSTDLVPIVPVFSSAEWLALAGFLAGYSGLTRQAYELDLRQFASWCQQRQLALFAARRADIECSPATWRPAAGPGPLSPPPVHHRRVLPLRRRGRTPGPFPSRARTPAPAGL